MSWTDDSKQRKIARLLTRKRAIRKMAIQQYLVTVTHAGKRYRGSYYLDGDNLVVSAAGLGEQTVDASLLDHSMDAAAMKLAKLIFKELLRETLGKDDTIGRLAAQGSTTRLTICGSTTQISL